MMHLWLLLVSMAFSSSFAKLTNLNLVTEWNELEYDFPSDAARQAALNSRMYVRGKGIPIDMAVHYRRRNATSSSSSSSSSCSIMNILSCRRPGRAVQARSISRVFVTVPRLANGVPLTLATISNKPGQSGPLLSPYPDWSSNQNMSCGGLTSVHRVAIDECNRLWVLDSGVVAGKQQCPPQLVIYNLDDNNLVRQFIFRQRLFNQNSSFVNLVVDVRDNSNTCDDTMVYMADVKGYGLVVYNNQNNTAWRCENRRMLPDPAYDNFTIEGDSFERMDGIFGMALTPKGSPNRQLYFHALSSSEENRVLLSFLDNRKNVDADPQAFMQIGNRYKQSLTEAMDRNGNLFFGLINPIAVACWDSSQSQYDRNSVRVVVHNNETLQFSSGLKMVQNDQNEEELWVLSNRYQRFENRKLSSSEVNFRIQAATIDTILGGSTKCTSAGSALGTYE